MVEDFFTNNSGGIVFDSSLSESFDTALSSTEYKNAMVDLFISINKERFKTTPAKQKVYAYSDRINGACPYCMDSMKDSYKKRGNIILKGENAGHFKCFNCGIYKPINDFLTDFKVTPNLELINYLSSIHTEHYKDSYRNYDISILINPELIEEYAIDREELKSKLNFTEVKQHPTILFWLKNRLQYDEERFLYNLKDDYLVVLNQTKTGKILGFQKRNFRKGYDKYKTFNIRKIYELIDIQKEIPEDVNVISQLYRIFELRFDKPIILFEGPLDAYLYPNAIASAGAHKQFPLEIPLWYFYDDDKVGRKKAIEKLNNNEYVFLWSKLKNDLNLPYREKWDLNDLKLYLWKENINTPNLENYFSRDPLDIINI